MVPERNPFPLTQYEGPDSFCDRVEELKRMVVATSGGSSLTIMARRRMGKSVLIHHFFAERARKKAHCVYVDLQPTINVHDMAEALATAIARDLFGLKDKITAAVSGFLSSIEATLKVGADGATSIEITRGRGTRSVSSIERLMDYLETQKKRVIVAFDEFQQIESYEDKNVDSILRAQLQRLKNTSFIFSGSNRTLMSAMFGDHKRPFYNSTEHMFLGPISVGVYNDFIAARFDLYRRKISTEALDLIHVLAERRTFNVQQLARRLWDSGIKKIGVQDVVSEHARILKELEHMYYGYQRLLTEAQWDLLVAIAHEGNVLKPFASEFANKYNLGPTGTIQRSLSSLEERELIVLGIAPEPEGYAIDDPWFAAWIRSTFVR